MSDLCFCGRNNSSGMFGMCHEHAEKWLQMKTENPDLTFEQFKELPR